jgi:glutathione synthase/RimK-type ligase-like ATP-grasp enzyme
MRVALVGCREVGTWPVAPSAGDPRPWERDDRPLVQALEELGAEVSRPAWDDPTVPWESFDLALLRATWDYHHRLDEFLSWVDRAGDATTVLNPPPLVRWNAHKSYLRDLAVPQPPTVWLHQGEEHQLNLGALMAERGWEVAFVKPAVGATAEGSLRFGRGGADQATEHVRGLLKRGEVLVQPYVSSVESRGERSAIVIDGEITHFVRKIPNPGDWRVQDDYGATDERHEPERAERTFAESVWALIAQSSPYRLAYGRIDWLMGEDGPWLVELELIEPCLFFRHGPGAALRLARAITIVRSVARTDSHA